MISIPPVEPDPVNPAQYQGDYVMRIIEDFGLGLDFCKGTVVKYVLRAGNKSDPGRRDRDTELQDLKKAAWYLARKIQKLERK